VWWAGGDSNSRPCGLERVSACKADVLSGAFLTGLNYRPTEKEPSGVFR